MAVESYHVLGLNASITRLLLLYVVNSQALLQNGMKSQAIWEHIVNSHVIRRTDINSWLLSTGSCSSSPMSMTGGKCWLQSITKQHQSRDPSAASPSPSRISHACGHHCFPLQFEPVPTRRQVFVATWAHCPPHSHHHGSHCHGRCARLHGAG